MSVRVMWDSDLDYACLYDSVTMTAFGPIFHRSSQGQTAEEAVHMFLNWLSEQPDARDPRALKSNELAALHAEFLDYSFK